LSWITILRKRENYRKAFSQFDAKKVARYDARRIARLLNNPGIVRNLLKVNSAVRNVRAFLKVQSECGSFDNYIWQFVDGKPIQNKWRRIKDIPAKTALSDAISKDLKHRGFNFVGSTIIYAFMQAMGMVNDHTTDCYRHRQVAKYLG
jgi:DNA-3-methyladenine glycosylase I